MKEKKTFAEIFEETEESGLRDNLNEPKLDRTLLIAGLLVAVLAILVLIHAAVTHYVPK